MTFPVKILFFGATRDATGESEIEFPFDQNAEIRDVLAELTVRFPALSRHKLLFAINQEHATGNETIRDRDELAIFTAVSGG
jgi:molybdopterin converting factor small subunit